MSLINKTLNLFYPKKDQAQHEHHAYILLERIQKLAQILNTTTNEVEFEESLENIKKDLLELSQYERTVHFKDSSPTDDLNRILKNESLTRKAFEERKEILNRNKEVKTESTQTNDDLQSETVCDNIIIPYPLFEYAGKFVIEREIASIGMLQRIFKIGFNKAAEIMDDLEKAGVVSCEYGTKPRKILMNAEMFESYLSRFSTSSSRYSNAETVPPVYDKLKTAKHFDALNSLGIVTNYSHSNKIINNLKNSLILNSTEQQIVSFTNNLIKYTSPSDLSIILLDSSQIIFTGYDEVKNLLMPAVSDFRQIESVINWTLAEMSDRTSKFLDIKVKNIESYNENSEYPLSKIVIILDEMYNFPKQSDESLIKLLLNSERFGIYTIFFSKFDSRFLSLGAKENLLSIKKFSDLESFFPELQSNYTYTENYDNMDGHQFEFFCADILRENGFENIEVTQGSGDHGIDIVAEMNDISYAIQCKCYSANIGNSAIQQAHTGRCFYQKDIAVVLTNQYFTEQAKQEAKVLSVKLWDRDRLNQMIAKCKNQ